MTTKTKDAATDTERALTAVRKQIAKLQPATIPACEARLAELRKELTALRNAAPAETDLDALAADPVVVLERQEAALAKRKKRLALLQDEEVKLAAVLERIKDADRARRREETRARLEQPLPGYADASAVMEDWAKRFLPEILREVRAREKQRAEFDLPAPGMPLSPKARAGTKFTTLADLFGRVGRTLDAAYSSDLATIRAAGRPRLVLHQSGGE